LTRFRRRSGSDAGADAGAVAGADAGADAGGGGGGGPADVAGGWRCAVCGVTFASEAERDGHVRALASPDVWLTAAPPPRAPAGGTDAASAAAAGAAHACTFCGGRFASRNQLFTHLKQTCAPAVDRTPRARTERYVVAVGYTGDRFHGSHTGAHTPAEEEARPSLEGWVLAAARRAWGGGEGGGEGAAAAGGGEGGEAVAGVWGVLRTEKGAHAAENLFVLSVRAELLQVRARMRIRFRARV